MGHPASGPTSFMAGPGHISSHRGRASAPAIVSAALRAARRGPVCSSAFTWSTVPQFMLGAIAVLELKSQDPLKHSHYTWQIWAPAYLGKVFLPQFPGSLENCAVWRRWNVEGALERTPEIAGGGIRVEDYLKILTSSATPSERWVMRMNFEEQIHLPSLTLQPVAGAK